MRRSKSFKPGPLSASEHQSHLIPSASSPRLQVQSPFCVSEGFSYTPSSLLISRWFSPSCCYFPSICTLHLGLNRSFSTPPGQVPAGAGAQRALLLAAGSAHRNHLREARLLDGFGGFSQAGTSHTGDHQHPELKGFVTRKAKRVLAHPAQCSLSYQLHQTHRPKLHTGIGAAQRKGRVRKDCCAHKTT